jgi:tetratricopeptide (TPR) repeat protein
MNGQDIAQKCSDISVLARSYNLRGIITRHQGDSLGTILFFQRALDLYMEVHDIAGQASSHNEIANAYFYTGQWKKAEQHYSYARSTFDSIGDIYHKLFVDNNLGGIALKQGNLQDALKFYRAALISLEQIGGSLWVLGALHMNLGHTYVLRYELTLARKHLYISLSYYEQAQSRDFLSELNRLFAEVALQENNLKEAKQKGEKSFHLAHELNMRGEKGISLRVLGDISIRSEHIILAKEQLTESVVLLHETGDEYEWARAQVVFARLCIVEKDFVGADERLELATAVFKKLEARLDLEAIETLKRNL